MHLQTALDVATIRLPGSDRPLVGVWLPFGFLGLLSWTLWAVRRFLTGLYSPFGGTFNAPTSVVAPAFREDPEILEQALRSWLAAGADEVVIVMPADEDYSLQRARALAERVGNVRIIPTRDTAKRACLNVGIQAARHEFVVLSDSDTLWEPELLTEVLKPFADPRVAGVGTRQRVLDPYSSLWRRAADWLLDSRYLCYVPAMSRKGGVSCLSGRTAAYRRSVLLPLLPELVDERFLGRRCVAGDDGRLTWLVLREGHRTVHQETALAWTMMPDTARGFLSQRVRWSRNSYRCYLRAISRGWLFRQPLITRISVLQGLLAPLSLTVGYGFALAALVRGHLVAVAIWVVWVMLGRGLRAFDHLRSNPRNLVLIPFMTALILVGFTVIKLFTFFTMNKQAWITRTDDQEIAEGQGVESLGGEAMARWSGAAEPSAALAE
jgi:cellulose synthase/poly-beta-1,6-N-acetylglucosamine synthase-like glycosyltransferase